MPEQVRCPSCNAALRVPDNLLGKNVKCPKCQTTFLAETEEPAESERIVREPRPPAARRRPRPPEDIEEEEELPSEDELEEVPEEEYDERPRRRRGRGRRRAEAVGAVAAPAIALLVLGILGILMGIANVGYVLVSNPAGQNPDPSFNVGFKAGRYIGAFVSLIWPIIIVVGAVNMKGLRSYGSAMTACIVAFFPCNLCCLLGIPFGIWGLVALNKPGVKDAFS